MTEALKYDIVVIGSGPSGQKAAIQGAKAGKRVLIIEKVRGVGGECVHHGTIPSKTLREVTNSLVSFKQRSGNVFNIEFPENLTVSSLMTRLERVVAGHECYIADQFDRNNIDCTHGRAGFVSPHEVEIQSVNGAKTIIRGDFIFIAVGSQPRVPSNVPVDHEHILDSDSILSMIYLPHSLTVLGAGVIASEYASIFAALGVEVTMINKYERPLGFLEPELTDRFLNSFERSGGRYIANEEVEEVGFNGLEVVTKLKSGKIVNSEKMLCAMGRKAALRGLNLNAAGLEVSKRGYIEVNEHCQTRVPHIYAIGDVIGPPALAASAMEQGRCAVCHALNMDVGISKEIIPVGIYAIPEIAGIGLNEAEASEKGIDTIVGRADFHEIARGHIADIQDGFLKMVADRKSKRLLGVQIVGEGATELIHLGQMAMICNYGVDIFVETVFNFPTLAEAYRVAALDILGKLHQM